MEIIESVFKLIERDPSSGVLLLGCILGVGFFMATRNQANAIALAASIVATFHPVETAITKLVENITTLNTNTLQSHTLIISLGERLTAHQKEQNAQHTVILQRFDSCQAKLHDILNNLNQPADLAELLKLNKQIQTDLTAIKELYENGSNAISSSIRRSISLNPVDRHDVADQTSSASRQTEGDSNQS